MNKIIIPVLLSITTLAACNQERTIDRTIKGIDQNNEYSVIEPGTYELISFEDEIKDKKELVSYYKTHIVEMKIKDGSKIYTISSNFQTKKSIEEGSDRDFDNGSVEVDLGVAPAVAPGKVKISMSDDESRELIIRLPMEDKDKIEEE